MKENCDICISMRKMEAGRTSGRGVGGCGVHHSPWIHREHTFRHRSTCRTPAESGQEYLTEGKGIYRSMQNLVG